VFHSTLAHPRELWDERWLQQQQQQQQMYFEALKWAMRR
jgi:hypothetical protein